MEDVMSVDERSEKVQEFLSNLSKVKMDFVYPGGMKARSIKKGASRPWSAIHNVIDQVKALCKKHGLGCDVRAGSETGYYHFKVWRGDNLLLIRYGYDHYTDIFQYAITMLNFVRDNCRGCQASAIKDKGSAINSLGPAV